MQKSKVSPEEGGSKWIESTIQKFPSDYLRIESNKRNTKLVDSVVDDKWRKNENIVIDIQKMFQYKIHEYHEIDWSVRGGGSRKEGRELTNSYTIFSNIVAVPIPTLCESGLTFVAK